MGRHKEVAGKDLGKLLTFGVSSTKYLVMFVGGRTVVHSKVADLMRGGVALYGKGSLSGNEDATTSLGNERSKDIVERHKCQPEPEPFAQSEYVDLLSLIDTLFVEEVECRLGCCDSTLPPGTRGRH